MRKHIGWMDRRHPIPRDKEKDYQDAGKAIEACVAKAVQQEQTNWREISKDIEIAIARVSKYLGDKLEDGEQIRNIWVHYRRFNGKPPSSVMDYFKKVQEEQGRPTKQYKTGDLRTARIPNKGYGKRAI